MIGDIKLIVTINEKEYSITELLPKENIIIDDRMLVVNNSAYEQLYRMLRRICNQYFDEEITSKKNMCKI